MNAKETTTITDDCRTTPFYWDCECKENYTHPKGIINECSKCGTTHEEQPDSRLNEVIAYEKLRDAAPELLEALKSLLSSYKCDFKAITGAELNETEAVKQAVNAIKKATQ
jgi:hypothetical protein